MKRIVGILGRAALALLSGAPAVFAQGCALCYSNAAATGAQGAATLRHAILVLAIPPLTIFSGILGMLYQRRNSSRDSSPMAEGMEDHLEIVLHPRSSSSTRLAP
jgi:hypothetical protein